MIEIEEGQALFEREIRAKKCTIEVSLDEAMHKVLAEDIVAPFSVPHFPKSAMDGYAVHHKDVEAANGSNPVQLKVVGELYAGDWADIEYMPRTAIRVMTGAFVPEGYNAVVKQEDTDYGEETVLINNSVKEYQNYCKVGEDIQKGDKVLGKGTYLKPVHIGLLASLGIRYLKVIEPVKVAIVSTGSELLNIGDELQSGKIYNSISHMISASIRSAGLDVSRSVICPDEEDSLKEAILDVIEKVDVVITTGGVSVGKKDLLPQVLEDLGGKVLFHGANIQPGTPTMGSMLKGKPVLSLSGNPYAAIANFELYFWNITCRLMGCNRWLPKIEEAVLATEYNKTNRLRRLIRASTEDGKVIIPTEVHSSSVISTLSKCNCFIDLEAGRKVQVGDQITIRYFNSI